jgi:hypothetical protein
VGPSPIEAWTADAADGVGDATKLAEVPLATGPFETLTYFGAAVDQGTYALLTNVQGETSDTGPVTATVVSVSGGTSVTEQVLADAGTDPLLPGYRQLLGFAGGYLWFAEVGDIGGCVQDPSREGARALIHGNTKVSPGSTRIPAARRHDGTRC